jgi:hypothetical protein
MLGLRSLPFPGLLLPKHPEVSIFLHQTLSSMTGCLSTDPKVTGPTNHRLNFQSCEPKLFFPVKADHLMYSVTVTEIWLTNLQFHLALSQPVLNGSLYTDGLTFTITHSWFVLFLALFIHSTREIHEWFCVYQWFVLALSHSVLISFSAHGCLDGIWVWDYVTTMDNLVLVYFCGHMCS